MASFHFRATCQNPIQERIVDFLSRNSQGETLICREYAKNEHIHALIHIDITKKSFCNKFKAKFPMMKGNKDYSCEEVKKTDRHMCQYICKGKNWGYVPDINPEVLYARALVYTIEEYHNAYWDQNPQMMDIKKQLAESDEMVQATPCNNIEKKPKKKTPTFMQLVRSHLEEEYDNIDGVVYQWSKKDLPKVFTAVMKKLGQHCKNLDHIIISRMTYGVLNSLIKDGKEWHEYWFKKAFPELENPYLPKWPHEEDE